MRDKLTLVALVALWTANLAAFIRHIYWTIMLMSDGVPVTTGKAVLAIGGILIPPLGVVHGFFLWFR